MLKDKQIVTGTLDALDRMLNMTLSAATSTIGNEEKVYQTLMIRSDRVRLIQLPDAIMNTISEVRYEHASSPEPRFEGGSRSYQSSGQRNNYQGQNRRPYNQNGGNQYTPRGGQRGGRGGYQRSGRGGHSGNGHNA